MNQFNDDQCDRVCDENDRMQKDINRLENELAEANTKIAKLTEQRDRARKYAGQLAVSLIDFPLTLPEDSPE